jgi:hypothetical protein
MNDGNGVLQFRWGILKLWGYKERCRKGRCPLHKEENVIHTLLKRKERHRDGGKSFLTTSGYTG